MTAPSPEQVALGNRCRVHAEMVLGLLANGDVDGADGYLIEIEQRDGYQMRRNVTDLIALRLGILPPEMMEVP